MAGTARSETGPSLRSILLMPVEARGGASKETAAMLTQMMASEGGKGGGYRLVSFKEVEGTMNQEQVRQVAGCDSSTCAAEIAGALNTDEIVMTSFGKVGDSFVLSASRVRGRDAQVVSRVSARFRDLNEDRVLDRLPLLMRALLSDDKQAAAELEAAEVAPEPAPAAPSRAEGNPGNRVLVAAGAGAGVGSAVFLVAALAASAGAAVAFYPWVRTVDTHAFTGIWRQAILTGLPLGLGVGAAVFLLVAVVLAGAGISGVGAGLVGSGT